MRRARPLLLNALTFAVLGVCLQIYHDGRVVGTTSVAFFVTAVVVAAFRIWRIELEERRREKSRAEDELR